MRVGATISTGSDGGLADLKARLSSNAMLIAAGRELLTGVAHAYEQEGPGWAALAASTRRERQRKGFGAAHPILRRTGAYARSWKAEIDGDTLVVDSDRRVKGGLLLAVILSNPGKHRPPRPVRVSGVYLSRALQAAVRVVLRA